MGQPPLMLLSLTDEGTAGTHKLASSTFVLYTTCVSHTSSKSCTHVLDQLKKMIRVFFFLLSVQVSVTPSVSYCYSKEVVRKVIWLGSICPPPGIESKR